MRRQSKLPLAVSSGDMAEIEFALPPNLQDKPIPADRDIVLSDAFLTYDPNYPKDEMVRAKQFLNLLAKFISISLNQLQNIITGLTCWCGKTHDLLIRKKRLLITSGANIMVCAPCGFY